ncbi:hypothetical protein ES705_40656 [subsurface metagenome]
MWREEQISSPVAELQYFDSEAITGTSYDYCIEKDGKYYLNDKTKELVNPSILNTGGADFYYIRIISSRNRFAAIGPIWVSVGV